MLFMYLSNCLIFGLLIFLFFPCLHTRIELNDMLWYLHTKWKAQKIFEVLDIFYSQVKRFNF